MKKLTFLLVIVLFMGCKKKENNTTETNSYPKMNLKNLHTEDKAVQTQLLLNAKEGKVVSLQIASGKQLKEHVSKVPALLLCVTGKGIYREASGKTTLEPGDYVIIKKDVKHQVDALTDSNFILVK
ncbi:hypothetical protein [uncultured Winogradskyella sp.]|uniref:hypothetical protein n=1 Tax=uncultured Winogradskyella sp. TaxID=395353 RepID=UPI0030D8AACE|tara:strand:- start:88184 stop:88561 length:378 start_codon:yes stop_codon:yes gene_type:complete